VITATFGGSGASRGGQVLHSASELRQFLRSLPATRGDIVVTRTPFWDRAPIWLIILVCLSLEWVMRRIG